MQPSSHKTEIVSLDAVLCELISSGQPTYNFNADQIKKAKNVLNDPNWEIIGMEQSKYGSIKIYFKRWIEGQHS